VRLFLSSYRFGDYGDLLLELLGEDTAIGVITNAKDYKTPEERTESVRELFASLQELGLQPHEINLRPFFGQPDFLRAELEKYTAVWLAGGNSFVLRRALKASGGDELLRELVVNDKLLYCGESAGAVMATPTLQGVEFGDDPDVVPEGYPDEDLWDGLGFVPYSIVPHYESDWEGYERMIEVLEEDNIPYKTLNDHQVIVVSDDEEERL
jgi:dipeptidase E